MAIIGQRIRDLRTSRGLTQEQLADKLNITKSRLGMYEIGQREPDFEMAEAIADYFNVDIDYLSGRSDIPNRGLALRQELSFDNIFPIETVKIPLLGKIACGEPIFADEDRESYVLAGANVKADFCLQAQGDSMIGARILDGDIVFIQKCDMVDNGEIAVVIIDDDATLKRVYYDREAGVLTLAAENPQYKTMRFMGEELNHIRILGRAVAFQSDVR